jgi:hypothetical protein
MFASKGKNVMKNVSIVASNTRIGRWIAGVWVGSTRIIVSVVAIVLGLSAPITATAGDVLTSGTFLKMETTGAFDLMGTVVKLTAEGEKSRVWTGGEAPRFEKVSKNGEHNWNSKWSMMAEELNEWYSTVLIKGLTKEDWAIKAKSIKAKYGDDGVKEFIALFASKETTGKVGAFTKALWEKGNDKGEKIPTLLDLANLAK